MAQTNKLRKLYTEDSRVLQISPFRLKDFDRLSISTSNGLQILPLSEIHFCKSSSNYTEIHMKNGKTHIVSKTLKAIEEKLNVQFLRVHNSYIVNLLTIEAVDTSKNELKTIKQFIIPISRSRKNSLIKVLQ